MQCCLFLSHGKSQHTEFQVFSEAMLLQPTPFRQVMETAGNRVEGLGSWDKPQKPQGGRQVCPPGIIVLRYRTEFTVLILGFLQLAAEMVDGVCGDEHPGGM